MNKSVENRVQAYAEMNKVKEVKEVRNPSGFHPLGRSVLVEPYEPAAKKPSMIVLPPSVEERRQMVEQRAVVIEVGPVWVKDEPGPRCKVGDHVMISKMAGFFLNGDDTLDGKSYRVVNHMDIFLSVEPEAPLSNENEE